MQAQEAPFAQRSRKKLHFDHTEMDYYFAWIVGRQVYGGSDPDECYEVAARITDGDPASWGREWPVLAAQVEAEAANALDSGEREAARGAYLRACTYYRAPLFIMNPDEPAFRELWRKMHDCFRQGAALCDPPIESVTVPFQGRSLSGYHWAVDGSGQPRPTLILVGGMETFAEDCYFMVGPAGPRRGYNVITVDLPGQGMNPDQGLYLEARMEIPVKAVVDYVLTRPDVDPERLAIYGFSWGGHIVFKGAQYDQRIKAMIANPAMPDVFRAARAQQSTHGRGDPVAKAVFSQIAWRMGLRISFNPMDLARRFGKAFDYLTRGKAKLSAITCPVLCIAGEDEAPITLEIARECEAGLPHPQKRLVIFTQEEGGAAHCQVDNLELANRVIFDWLDQVLSKS